MKYSLKQEVVDSRGNPGMIVDVRIDRGRAFYQVLFDRDWGTERAAEPDFIPEEYLRVKPARRAS
jgi:enolase